MQNLTSPICIFILAFTLTLKKGIYRRNHKVFFLSPTAYRVWYNEKLTVKNIIYCIICSWFVYLLTFTFFLDFMSTDSTTSVTTWKMQTSRMFYALSTNSNAFFSYLKPKKSNFRVLLLLESYIEDCSPWNI